MKPYIFLEAEVKNMKEINDKTSIAEDYRKLMEQYTNLQNEGISETVLQRNEIGNLKVQMEQMTLQINHIKKENTSLKLKVLELNTENASKLHTDETKLADDIQDIMSTLTDETIELDKDHNILRGLPDTQGNMCFMISAVHTLCRILPLDENNVTGKFATILKSTKDLIDGNIASGPIISKDLWQIVEENWPEYSRSDGRSIQGDVAEFIMRFLNKVEEDHKDSTVNIQTIVNSSIECTNRQCKLQNKRNSVLENIIVTSQIPDESKLSLQQVIDGFTPQLGTRFKTQCDMCGKETEESCSLLLPTPTIILQVDKVPRVGNKDEIEIYTNQTVTIPIYNSPGGQTYSVTDVIVHKGSQSSNGHYITTHFNDTENQWELLNNEKGRVLTEAEAHQINKHGILYVLKASNSDEVVEKSNGCLEFNQDYEGAKTVLSVRNYNNTSGTGLKRGETHVIHRNGISSHELEELEKIHTVKPNTKITQEDKDRVTPAEKENQLRKNGICIKFNKGVCNRGSRCYYKHVKVKDYPVEEPTVNSYTYPSLQQPYKNYTHPTDLPKNKSKLCREFWLHGRCKIGNFCSLNHVKSNSDDHNKVNQDSNKKTHNYQPAIRDHQTQKVKQICPQYKFGRCTDYEYCKEKYDHPRRCRDMVTFGECKYGDNCKYYHPKICHKSMENLHCTDLSCPFFHLKWTKRFAEERRSHLYSNFEENPAEKNISRNIFYQHKAKISEAANQREQSNINYPEDNSANNYWGSYAFDQQTQLPDAEYQLPLTRENYFLPQQNMDTNITGSQLQNSLNYSTGAQSQVPRVRDMNPTDVTQPPPQNAYTVPFATQYQYQMPIQYQQHEYYPHPQFQTQAANVPMYQYAC